MKIQKYPFISVIIPVEEFNPFLGESLPKYKDLDYPNFEVLVFTTKPCNKKFTKVKFIPEPSYAKNPAKKRDLALKYAKGEWFAFIDDDAYPSESWLRNASRYFDDNIIAAICGPGVTPKNVSVLEKASGWVSASKLGGASYTYRFIPQSKRYVDDYPSMNLIIRKKDFEKVGGFDSSFYPGEDTKLCLDITYGLNKKIIYDPNVLVYHHRRSLFKKHLLQNGKYGVHRGYFARTLPQTSRRLSYFIPTFFTLGILSGPILYFLSYPLFLLWTATVLIYIFLLSLTSVWVYSKEKNVRVSLLVIPGIFLTHIWYGIKFIQGFLSKELRR